MYCLISGLSGRQNMVNSFRSPRIERILSFRLFIAEIECLGESILFLPSYSSAGPCYSTVMENLLP